MGGASSSAATSRDDPRTAATIRRERVPRPANPPSQTVQSVDDVLYANEIQRSRVWVWLCTMLGVAGVGYAPFGAGPTLARWLLAAGCGTLLVASAIALWVLRDERRYSRRLAALFSRVCVACMLPAYYYFGWFSAITILVPLGGITFALGQSRRSVIDITILTCGTHAAFALATIFGVIDDRGAFVVHTSGRIHQLLLLAFVQACALTSFMLGRLLRGHTLAAVAKYGDAVRDAALREALLQEALQELNVARHGGGAGRFTGMNLGSFTLGPVIGRGAMGEVYEAEHAIAGQRAAVKVMTATSTRDSRAVERFDREIRIAATLDSPHIARVLEHSRPDDAIKYLAMERLVGRSLGQLAREGPLSIREVLAIFDQVASAIDCAHSAGIVHRDLKPGNLYAVVHTMPPRPSAVAAVPQQLDAVLAIALAKEPEHRFGSARELSDALIAAHRTALSDDLQRRGEALTALTPWRS